MSSELVPVTPQRKYRKQIPDSHRQTLDTRILWLWNQRFGTVQMIWKDSPDVLDKTAATLFLQAVLAKDLDSIAQIFQRLEGGALTDEALLEQAESQMRV
jgi:hypothetical protein